MDIDMNKVAELVADGKTVAAIAKSMKTKQADVKAAVAQLALNQWTDPVEPTPTASDEPTPATPDEVVARFGALGIALTLEEFKTHEPLARRVYEHFATTKSARQTGSETTKSVICRLLGEVVETREDGVLVGHTYAKVADMVKTHFAAQGVIVGTTSRSVACYKAYAKAGSHGVRGEIAEAILAIGHRQ